MSDDFIKKALGMEILPPVEDAKMLVPYEPEENDNTEEVDRDIDFARENMIELVAKGTEALDELIMIAKQSQHPRAFEVVANLLKTTADLNSDLVNLHKKRKDITAKDPAAKSSIRGPDTVNNNLFVGSTAELQKMLMDMQKTIENKDE